MKTPFLLIDSGSPDRRTPRTRPRRPAVFAAMVATLLCMAPATGATELVIDVDAFDNPCEPQYVGAKVYGPEHIRAFFANCRKHGVARVYWRSQCQIASYRSKLNYSCADELAGIRSAQDARRHSGAFAAKVGVLRGQGGLTQAAPTQAGRNYVLEAWISAPKPNNAALAVIDTKSNKPLARSKVVTATAETFVKVRLPFTAPGPVRVAVLGRGGGEMNVFVVDDLSLRGLPPRGDAGKELLRNGGFENFVGLVPTDWDASSANFVVVNGDPLAMTPPQAKKLFARDAWRRSRKAHPSRTARNRKAAMDLYDSLAVAVREAHKHGVEIYAWFDPLDDGQRRPPLCGGAWVSRFHEDNPRYRLVDREGNRRWGMLCFGYEAVRKYKTAVVAEMLDYGVDGIYLKTAFQHNHIWDSNPHRYDQYLYNDVALAQYDRRWGKPTGGAYDPGRLKVVHGEFFVRWIREASTLVRGRGKKLAFSMRPGESLEALVGSWRIDWRALVNDRVIDEFLLEPRLLTRHKGVFASLDRQYGYAALCRKAGVKLGFDFYLNALAEGRLHPASATKDPYEYFAAEITEIARWPVDFVGVYEGMYLYGARYWPALAEARRRMGKITNAERLAPAPMPTGEASGSSNVALAARKARATVRVGDTTRNAGEIIDGDIGDASHVDAQGTPVVFTIELAVPTPVDYVRIYPGLLANAGNPSGECGIAAYRLEGRANGNWMPLLAPVTDAPTALAGKSVTAYDFYYTHKLPRTPLLDGVRLIVTESSDTGRRVYSRHKVCIPANKRETYLREVQVHARAAEK